MDRTLDHALTTIDCTLDGMEAVIQMFMEVKTVNAEAVRVPVRLLFAYRK